jgi:hypothetical protein
LKESSNVSNLASPILRHAVGGRTCRRRWVVFALEWPAGRPAQLDPGWCISMSNCSANGKRVYFGIWEDLSDKIRTDLLRGYVGFKETFEARPLSKILEVAVDTGESRVVFEEKNWIGHVNTSPTQRNLLTFCHEGPWNLVDQRVWGLDVDTGEVWKIRPTSGEETGAVPAAAQDGLPDAPDSRGPLRARPFGEGRRDPLAGM